MQDTKKKKNKALIFCSQLRKLRYAVWGYEAAIEKIVLRSMTYDFRFQLKDICGLEGTESVKGGNSFSFFLEGAGILHPKGLFLW